MYQPRRILALCLFFCLATEGHALTDEEIYEAFQFNFSLPGARSSAMGRTFIGLADDATASVSNPAGLATLQFPEVSLEVKLTDHDIQRRAGAESFLEPDTRHFGLAVPQLSFISLAYPYKNHLVVALYRYESFGFDEQFELEPRQLLSGTILPPTEAEIEMTISNWGGTLAFRLPMNFSFGVAFSASLLDMQTRTTHLTPTPPVTVTDQTVLNDVDWSLSSTIGLLYRPSERFSAGTFFHFNPTFEVQEELIGFEPESVDVPVRIRVPDRFGFGIAVRPINKISLVLDVLRVLYSQQTGGNFRTLVRFPELEPRDFQIRDVWELHGGIELQLPVRALPLFLRGGLFTNPGHPLRYTGPTNSLAGRVAREVFSVSNSSTNLAYTLGIGSVLGSYLQVDLAYLDASLFDEVTGSVIFHIR